MGIQNLQCPIVLKITISFPAYFLLSRNFFLIACFTISLKAAYGHPCSPTYSSKTSVVTEIKLRRKWETPYSSRSSSPRLSSWHHQWVSNLNHIHCNIIHMCFSTFICNSLVLLCSIGSITSPSSKPECSCAKQAIDTPLLALFALEVVSKGRILCFRSGHSQNISYTFLSEI